MTEINHQQIAILDFGSQYTHLVARRFRQLGILAKLYPTDFDVSKIDNLIGIVLSGSPGGIGDQDYPFNKNIFELGVPVLGLCYGHQLMADYFGGQVRPGQTSEFGKAVMQVGQTQLFDGLEGGEIVWMSHGDSVEELPKGFKTIGQTDECPIAAMANEAENFYGLQFHPEVTHTNKGLKILENFAFKICQAHKDWQMENWQTEMINQIKLQADGKKVFLLVSGGVDSTVCFALLNKALGKERVFGLHVDTGLMRKNEVEQIQGALGQAGFDNLEIYDASEMFLKNLEGVILPEEKRKIIGRLFVQIHEDVSKEYNLNPEKWLLGQGTIYPDTIESGGTKNADVIKTHHNRVDKIQEMMEQGRVIEPIKDLYKDEVRLLGEALGLSEKLVWRQPFPGPGLGIRVLSNDLTDEEVRDQEFKDIEQKLSQSFARIKFAAEVCEECEIHLLPIKSVGVQGDNRTYAHPCVLQLPISNLQLPIIDWPMLEKISPQITNAMKKQANRVLIQISNIQYPRPKADPPMAEIAKAGLIKASLTKERLDLLREIDAIVQAEVFSAGLEKDIWQFPVVLIPFGLENKESIVLRPVSSLEAMTASFYPLDQEVLEKIVKKIEALNKISFIFFDATNKPPGTIEWE